MTSLPGYGAWQARAAVLGLKRSGRELIGPCPACGGDNRFRVTPTGGAFCRQCCPDGSDAAAFRRLIEAAGFAWPTRESRSEGRTGALRSGGAEHPRKAASTPQRRSDGDSGGVSAQGNEHQRKIQAKIARARRLWSAAVPDPGLVRAYLGARGCWPPHAPLPDSVRWLSRAAITALRWREGPDDDAAGAMACCYTVNGAVTSVSLDALRADGTRCAPRWQRTLGERRGAAFRVPGPDAPGDPLALAEGDADALAIRTWTGCEAWSGGGTAGVAALALALAAVARPVTVHCDGDGPGRKAAFQLQDDALARGVQVRVAFNQPGSDPAKALTEAWAERVAILEADAGLSRSDAEHAAWAELKPADGGADPQTATAVQTPRPAREA